MFGLGHERLLNSGHGQDLLCAIGQCGDHAAGGPQDVQHHAGGPRQVSLGQCLEISRGEGGLQSHGGGLYGRQAARCDSYS